MGGSPLGDPLHGEFPPLAIPSSGELAAIVFNIYLKHQGLLGFRNNSVKQFDQTGFILYHWPKQNPHWEMRRTMKLPLSTI